MSQTQEISSDGKVLRIGSAGVFGGLGLIASVFTLRGARDASGNITSKAGNLALLTYTLFGLAFVCIEPVLRRKNTLAADNSADTPALEAPQPPERNS